MNRRRIAIAGATALGLFVGLVGPQVVTAAGADSAPAVGIVRHATIPTAPCEHEDGPGPCFYDAGSVGNGQGLSFWIDCEQFTHYLDPQVQAKMDRIVNGPERAYDSTCGEAS